MLDLDPETMRRLGYGVVDHLVARLAGLDAEPAWAGAPRSVLEPRLHRPAPETAVPFEAVLDELRTVVLPFAARVDHPRFMAFVPGSPTWPGILADLLATGHNLFQGTWLGASGPSQIEIEVLEWFRTWLGMPPGAGGLFTSGGSAATLIAIAAARRLRFGAHDPRAVVYRSAESHSSVERALAFLGFAEESVRVIADDAGQRMSVPALEAAIEADTAAGRIPFLVVASAGSTSTGAVDPLEPLGAVCAAHGLWLHVDAAYGGFAALTERGRGLLAGLERAQSITLDPHKWLYQPFEAGCLMVRDPHALEAAFRVVPDYLKDAEIAVADPGAAVEVNFTDRGFQLTRTARALKVWVSIHTFGLDAFRATIDRTMDLAEHAERRIRGSDELELVTPARLGIVCFRRRVAGADEAGSEAANTALIRALAESGVGMISSTRVNGRLTLRACIMNHRTRVEDVDRVLDWLESAPVPVQAGADASR